MPRPLALLTVLLGGLPAAAQTFAVNTLDIPAGAPFNAGFTENVEMLDIDGDGDSDAVWANGGDFGNEQNRIWINRGGLQGAVTGNFRDETAQRYPSVLDDSRDVDFVDLDGDGDFDLFISNTSGVQNQTNRFLVNMGGAQGGSAGYFQDQTSTRWVDIAVNNNQSHSSVAPTTALASGGFIDWSCDTTMVDLDNDGDADLIEATYGSLALGRVPTRIFLNDGDGYFEEFNPSGFQLTNTDIANGNPALWCDGVHQHQTTDASGAQADIANESISVDAGDLDGDFDLDFVLGDRTQLPRVFRNRTVELAGALGFRDASWSAFIGPDWAPSTGSYEQDLGDVDNDGDLDIFGANWSNVCDKVLFNDGAGVFASEALVANSCVRHNEPDFIDYDNDGWLDTFTASRTAPEQLYRNLGPSGAFVMDEVTAATMPLFVAQALGGDTVDADLDGDYDVFLANDAGDPNTYLQNLSGTPDTHAPRIPRVEQAPTRNAGPDPTAVRAHVYDNAPWYVASFAAAALEYRLDGGAFVSVPMHFVGGQIFRGEIPANAPGTIDYRVVATDTYGNTGTSVLSTFVIHPCNGDPLVYCTAKTHSNGCVPAIGSSGVPSASAASGFVITSSNTLPNRSGLLFYSTTGPKALAYQAGYLCVQSPTVRTPLQNSGASGVPPCDGQFAFDFNAWIAAGSDVNLLAGAHVWAQYWSRDPAAPFQTNRSDALAFHICP
jgi:hypothetical protein